MSDDPKGNTSMTGAIVIGVLIAVIPATLGYFAQFLDGIRKDRLAFTNNQLEKLYGALYALTQASVVTWKQFVASNWPNKSKYFFDPAQPPSIEQVTSWRLWMRNVFQPMNLMIEQTIVSNSQLVVGNEMPPVFQKMIAQTEAYKAIMAGWKDTDKDNPDAYRSRYNNTVTDINYPEKIVLCVAMVYRALKDRQEVLQHSIIESFRLAAFQPPCECNQTPQ